MRSVFCRLSLIVALAAPLHADTLELTSGITIEGTVLGYSNLHFQVSTPDLKTSKHALAYVKRVSFEERSQAATLQTRTGPIEGKLVSFQGTSFLVRKEDGKEQQVQSIFVKQIIVPRPGKEQDLGVGESGPTDILEIPEAVSHGEEVALKDLLAPGKVTLVFFYGNLGPGVQCRLLNNYLNNIASKEFRVAISKIDIGQWDSAVAKQYSVKAVPRLDIYDSSGRLVHTVEGNRLPEISAALKKTR